MSERNPDSGPLKPPRPDCIMDWPTAWRYVREQHPDPAEHHPKCSWATQNGALLCDCDVLESEYQRRKAEVETARARG